jgi:L-ascorbate metabolism protein UlaG (beta-lactamase superfamily)
MDLIKPKQKDDTLLADIFAFRSEDKFKVWWLGQSGFLLKWKGAYLLLDPYLSDSLTVKYAETDKPHTRMGELVINPADLNFVHVVTSSHNHTDHLDAETLNAVIGGNPSIQFVIPEANRDFVAARLGCDKNFPIGLNDGETTQCGLFRITAVPAAHNTVERDERGLCKYLGYVIQFGPYAVYHSGDTLWYEGMEDILKEFDIDIAFLPINGNKPERKVAGNLNPEEAALLGKAIRARLVIPHHYHMFSFNTEDPGFFVDQCRFHDVPYKVLELGGGFVNSW